MKDEGRNVTIYDVAKRASTSASTVSRVLNNTGYPVRETLRQSILTAAHDLGYVPNLVAKSLKSNKTKDIGVIIPTITNPFYSSVILGVEEEANKCGYNILLCNSSRDVEKEKKYIQSLYQKQIRGFIISSVAQKKDNVFASLHKDTHLVLLDQVVSDVECSRINFDCQKGAYMAVEHLIKNGHEKIAFISTPLTRWTRKEIFKGYKKALKAFNLPLNEDYLMILNSEEDSDVEGFEFKTGRLSAEMFVSKQVDATAVFAVNDMTAFGFIQEVTKLGKKVPKDVSIVGFDDISFASMFTPALTTIRYPCYEIGNLAAKLLFEKLSKPEEFDVSLYLEPKLVIRDSVKKLG